MRTPFLHVVMSLVLAVSVSGCINTRIEYFVDRTYRPNTQVERVEWLAESPVRAYFQVARVTVSSTSVDEATLRQSLLNRARKLGADAVIAERPIVIETAAPTPYYERGLLGPMGAAFGLYGYGWYTPYSSNPYILVQGAVDQPRVDHYLSGIAIRYEEGPDKSLVP